MNDYKLVPVEPEMLPCPFCGGTDAFVERQDYCSAYVVCSSMLDEHSCCYAQGPVGIQEDDGEEIPGATAAIAAWNQRAAPAVQGEPVAWMTGESWRRMRGGGKDSRGTVPVRSKRTSVATIPLYAAPQPAEQQPDVTQLVEALKSLVKGYVNLLEAGRDRITSLGGDCDPVSVMEHNDPWLRAARAALATHRKGDDAP